MKISLSRGKRILISSLNYHNMVLLIDVFVMHLANEMLRLIYPFKLK